MSDARMIDLFNFLEANREVVLSWNDEKFPLIAKKIRAAFHLDDSFDDKSVRIDRLNHMLQQDHIPYWVASRITEDKQIQYKIRRYLNNCPTAIAKDHLERYLRDFSQQPCNSFYIMPYLQTISYLYRIGYGIFYKGDENHVFTPEELNIVFMHQQIPFQFTRFRTSLNGHSTEMYHAVEVNW